MRCINRRFPVHSILIHQGGYRAYRTSETTTDCVACRSGKAGVAGAAPENRAAHGATFQDRSSCWQGTGQSGDRSATERDRRNRREVEGEVSDQGNGGEIGRGHVRTPVTATSRMPSSAS